ncbi:MAG: hypothetical protein JO317_04415 [Verrucomicrobiae bacterium]|nr:hypothetical protein [Verrucomicrobiae bacterium]
MRAVRIEGGGIAGQVLARELSARGVPCDLIEKKTFPRPKVCGGVLQADSWEYLREAFSLPADVAAAELPTISHFWRGRRLSTIRFRKPMVFAPRFELDAKLSESRGGEFTPESDPLVVRASGAPPDGDWVGLEADGPPVKGLEMHYNKSCYLGLCESGAPTSHCAVLARRSALAGKGDPRDWIERESGVRLLNKPRGTASIRYGYGPNDLAVGDAKLTTHPFLGLGMRHAIESARLMARCIAEDRVGDYSSEHRRAFSRYHRASSLLEAAYDSPLRFLLGAFLVPSIFEPAYRWVHQGPSPCQRS